MGTDAPGDATVAMWVKLPMLPCANEVTKAHPIFPLSPQLR